MKHLPNELLYLLKVYNFITREIGLDKARSRSEEIREYIRQADFLNDYPTVREYLSEDKTIDDILTYIQRNEKTYSLLGEWKDGEIAALFKSKGIEGAFCFTGSFYLDIDKDGYTYFTLPYKPCILHKVVLLGADNEKSVHVEEILWLEFYRTKEAFCIEIFDNNCNTVKVSFSDFEVEKKFLSGLALSEGCKTTYEAISKMSSFVWDKFEYDENLLSDGERAILPIVGFFASLEEGEYSGNTEDIIQLFNEYAVEKGEKLIKAYSECDSEKKKLSVLKKIKRLLMSKKCRSFMEEILERLINTQKDIPENITLTRCL